MYINFYFACILAIILAVVIPTILILFVKNRKLLKKLAICFGVLYFIFLMIFTTAHIEINTSYVYFYFNLSFNWFSAYRFIYYPYFSIKDIIFNLIMFIPLGALGISIFEKNRFVKTLALSFCLSVFVEFMQFVLPVPRCVEFQDIILNVISGIIGFATFRLIEILGTKKIIK